ncbi:MAG: carbon storage regulator [Pirellulales bacterium]
MLVLSRKKQEAVVVAGPGGDSCFVKVTVLEIRPGHVRLGFEAHSDVPVHRWEVWQRLLAFPEKAPPSDGKGVSGTHRGSSPSLLEAE